jgi:hypothetical protein
MCAKIFFPNVIFWFADMNHTLYFVASEFDKWCMVKVQCEYFNDVVEKKLCG